MKIKIVIIVLLLTLINLKAQEFEKVDSLCSVLIKKYNLKNIGFVGVQDDKIVYNKLFVNTSGTDVVTDSSRIYIASNTKAFIALAMEKLAYDNRINYSDPISKYIETTYFTSDIDVDKIKIKDLMQHTHGLSNDPLVFRTAYSGEYPADLKELLKFTVYREDTLSNNFHYSNLGYLIAGIIIKEVTKLDWKKYLDINILKPIGMTNTTANMDFNPDLEILPYDYYSEDPLTSRKTENTLHSAGGLYSTLSDMAKWLMVFTDETQNSFSPNLIKEYLAERTLVNKNMGPFKMDEYGNGWIYGSLMGEDLFYHFGSFNGYESVMSFQPSTKRGVFVFINERIGGQRIASMLTSYFYLTANNDNTADDKIKSFYQFIDPLYDKEKKIREIFEYADSDELRGTYVSQKYGNLIVDKVPEGYTFSIGKLKSIAYKGLKPNEILIEWTPGTDERFIFSKDGTSIKLQYDDFGEFIKE